MTEKGNFNSKKFVAFFFSILVVAGILIATLFTQTFSWAIALVMGLGLLIIGVMSISYVNKQGTLDKFIEATKAFLAGIKPND